MKCRNKKKCGFNFLPDWVFNDPIFNPCCVKHDCDYEQLNGKLRSDYAFLICNIKTAKKEKHPMWRMLQFIQGVLLFSLVVFLPFSYLIYGYYLIKNKLSSK